MASVAKRKWTYNGVEKEAWTVRYKDPTGSYRQKIFDRKKDADRYRAKIATELESGDHIAPAQSRTVAAAAKLFLEEVDNRVAIGSIRPSTGKNYHCAFRQAILPALGGKLVLDVNTSDLESWYHQVIRSKRMEPVTARRRLVFLKLMFDFATRHRWARTNPASVALDAVGRPRKSKIDTFSVEAVRRVIVAANTKRYNGRQRAHEMTQLAVNLAAFCGLRWGEIFGLAATDVNLGEKVLHVRHTLDCFGNLQEPKTKAGVRDVPLPNHIAKMLCDWLRAWPSTHPAGILLTSHSGAHMIATNFRQNSWLPLLSSAGVATDQGKPLHFHALRHFAVSWMIENGWPVTDVSHIVGHANVAITLQVYAHALKGRRQSADAMQALAEKLLAEQVARAPIALLNDATIAQEQENGVLIDAWGFP